MRVLVLDANSKIALAAVRAMGVAGHEVFALGPRFSISHFSKFCTERLTTVNANLTFDELTELIGANDIDIMIPVSARSVELVHRNRDSLSKIVKFALPEPRSLDIALDKFRVQDVAEKIGVKVPKAFQASSYKLFVSAIRDTQLPFVVRSTSHRANSKTIYIRTETERCRLIEEDGANHLFLDGAVQIQQMVEGPGEGFFAVYQHGVLKRHMMHRRLGEYPTTGGSSWLARSIHAEDLFAQGKALLDELNWHGPAMVEFKRNESDGDIYLMELNPKLWGSLDLTIEAGVDLPRHLVAVASEENLEHKTDFKSGVVYWWPLDNWVALLGFWKIRFFNFSTNIWPKDLLPAAFSFAYLLYSILFEKIGGGFAGKLLGWFRNHGIKGALLRFVNQSLGLPTTHTSRIDEHLWIGAKPSILGGWWLEKIKKLRIYSLLPMVSMNKENGTAVNSAYSGFHIPEYVEISLADYSRATREIESMTSLGQGVYIHCREGVGRAPAIGAAVLICEGQSIEEALDKVGTKRKVASLSHLQMASLEEFYRRRTNRDQSNGQVGV